MTGMKLKAKTMQAAHARRPGKGKAVKREPQSSETIYPVNYEFQGQGSDVRPSVEIANCISFQKFRYKGEKRPGKKYQEKDFMELTLCHLADRVVRIVIICTDAENKELIHPNGLVGKDCHDGIYDKEYSVTKSVSNIKIPYLRTERIKTKKKEHEKIQSVLEERALHLPTPYKERCLSQCTDKYTSSRKFDTTKVCLGVIVTVISHKGEFNGSLHAISHVVRNASEKTSLAVLKLSSARVSASEGGLIDIFTTEDGPAIEHDKYDLYVTFKDLSLEWESGKRRPQKSDILYNRVIQYQVPPFEPYPYIETPTQAYLHIDCPQSNQSCNYAFSYVPEHMLMEESRPLKRKMHDVGITLIPSKRMHVEEESVGSEQSTDQIKASLKSKLIRNRDSGNSVSTIGVLQYDPNYEVAVQGSNTVTYAASHYPTNAENGEIKHVLNMDSKHVDAEMTSEASDSNNSYQTIVALSPQTSGNILDNVVGLNGTNAFSSDVRIVATGYSHEVPPNTTVYICDANGGSSEATQVLADSTTDGRVVVHEVEEQEVQDAEPVSKLPGQNETDHYHSTDESAQQMSSVVVAKLLSHSPSVIETRGKDINNTHNRKEHQPFDFMTNANNVNHPASSSHTISRVVKLDKSSSEASPWAVNSDDDSSGADNIFGERISESIGASKTNARYSFSRDLTSSPHRSSASLFQPTITRAVGKSLPSGKDHSNYDSNSATKSQEILFKGGEQFSNKTNSEGKELNSIGLAVTQFLQDNDVSDLSTLEVSKIAKSFGM